MLHIAECELEEIIMDLDGILSLLTVMSSSDYYKNTGDANICRALGNCVEHTKDKLTALASNAERVKQ